MPLERLSIELTNTCTKGCSFCYNQSNPRGQTLWTLHELTSFIRDCAQHGTRAVSLGGGEPLDFDGLEPLLEALDGVVFRSITTHGLYLKDPERLQRLVDARPDKVHISIHRPEQRTEVERVISQVLSLQSLGISAGINLLVAKDKLEHVRAASKAIFAAGLNTSQLVYLPMRDLGAALTPSPEEIVSAADTYPIQSMSCLLGCAKSPRFCAIGFDKMVSWCSYTSARRPLPSLDAAGLLAALKDLPLTFCGEQPR